MPAPSPSRALSVIETAPKSTAALAREAQDRAQNLTGQAVAEYLANLKPFAERAAEVASLPGVHVGIKELTRRFAAAVDEHRQAVEALQGRV
jgi:hypothetical protein